MKIGIIGDSHFGASYNLGRIDPETQHNSRLLDFSNTFDSIIDVFIKNGVKVVILTGDIFETRHPTSSQLSAFSRCIQRAIDSNIDIRIVVGNHDQQRSINTTTVDIYNELKLDGIKVYSEISLFKIDNINIITLPYRDRRMLGADTNSGAIQILRDKVSELVEQADGFKILVGHMMLERTSSDDNPDGFSINELVLPHDMFNGIDISIMGHIHRHSIVSDSPKILYSGSMERVSFGEKDHKKVSLVIDTDTGNVDIIDTDVRSLFEIDLSYDNKIFKNTINDKIIEDISDYAEKNDLTDSVVRVIIKVNENDNYYINQQKIKDHLLTKNINYFYGMQVVVSSSRQLRNKEITEDISGLKAIEAFIAGLQESDAMKNKLLKHAKEIIAEVDGK